MAQKKPPVRGKKRNSHTAAGILFALPWIIGFLAFSLYPIVMSVYYSLTDFNMFQAPKFVGLENYTALFQDEKFYKSLWNTMYMTVLGTPLSLLVGLLMALLLNQKVRGMPFFRTLFYLPSVVPLVASSMLWLWILNPQYGLLNQMLQKLGLYQPNWLTDPDFTKPALLIMGVWGVGGIMIIFLAALQDVPRSLYEAAEIDGAGTLKKFVHITLPGISTITFFLILAGITAGLTTFDAARIMAPMSWDGYAGPENAGLALMYYIYIEGVQFGNMGYASILSWILFLVMMIPSVYLIRKRILSLEDL